MDHKISRVMDRGESEARISAQICGKKDKKRNTADQAAVFLAHTTTSPPHFPTDRTTVRWGRGGKRRLSSSWQAKQLLAG